MLVDDLDQFSVEVVAPGVVATPDALLGESTIPVGEAGATVQTGVVEGANGLWSDRTTRIDWSPMRYSQKSPTSAISSSRQATCHTRDQRRSNSSSANSGLV